VTLNTDNLENRCRNRYGGREQRGDPLGSQPRTGDERPVAQPQLIEVSQELPYEAIAAMDRGIVLVNERPDPRVASASMAGVVGRA